METKITTKQLLKEIDRLENELEVYPNKWIYLELEMLYKMLAESKKQKNRVKAA